MRSAALFEQPRGKRAQVGPKDRAPEGPRRKGDWFLHDDRAEEPPARQGTAPAARQAGRSPAANHSWEYKDLDGKVHGPFSSQKMAQWVDKDYFQMDLQVRRAGSSSAWAPLQQQLPQMSGPSAGGAQARAMPQAAQHAASKPDAVHARASAFSRLDIADSSANRRGAGRGSDDGAGGRGGGRGGNDSGRGRGGRQQEIRNRTGGGRGSRAAPQAGPRAALTPGLARGLFTNNASQATDQPLWRYIDLSGQIQGPFTASNMLDWYTRGYLEDPQLLIIGHDRQVAPPNLPPTKLYRPLGELLSQGNGYQPVTPEDIKVELAQPQTPSETQNGGPAEAATAAPPSGGDDAGVSRAEATAKEAEAAVRPVKDDAQEPDTHEEDEDMAVNEQDIAAAGTSVEETVQEMAHRQEEPRQPVETAPASNSSSAVGKSAEGGAISVPAGGDEANISAAPTAADDTPNETAQSAVTHVPAADEDDATEEQPAPPAEPAQGIAIADEPAAKSEPISESVVKDGPLSTSESCVASVDSSTVAMPVQADDVAAAPSAQD